MPYLNENDVRRRAAAAERSLQKSAGDILLEETTQFEATFDVFLSHSSAEPEWILLGVKKTLELYELSVYVDQFNDSQLSPENVTRDTAETLRHRMRNSKSLLYVHSQYSKRSRWMPWELGFFDGLKGKVGILPVAGDHYGGFENEEYLNLYPYITLSPARGSTEVLLWIKDSADTYARFDWWVENKSEIRKHL
jgi:hypothetical protein